MENPRCEERIRLSQAVENAIRGHDATRRRDDDDDDAGQPDLALFHPDYWEADRSVPFSSLATPLRGRPEIRQ